MRLLLMLCLAYGFHQSAFASSTCRTFVSKRKQTITFSCTELKSLQEYLDRARRNTTNISIYDSDISNVAGHSFTRFAATLTIIDMHEAGIQTIEAEAFVGLTRLKELILWGNKLRMVLGNWFVNMNNLQTLDLSFNLIEVIDYSTYQLLPSVENFYFDYNQLKALPQGMFAYMRNLRRVRLGKNPWKWAYRVSLTWQLENQKVEYDNDWEDWEWMNVAIKDCIEIDRVEFPSDKILDCLVGKLLNFAYESVPYPETLKTIGCYNHAKNLVRCMRPTNATGNSNLETVRRILQDYVTVLPPMLKSLGAFTIPSAH
ncbi:hypothetical protein KM043_005529 [Ampulex compressa]|nr:hypothetical protein KM043_005529 [Ampulex compressa]